MGNPRKAASSLCLAHLPDLLAHQWEQPDVKQHLPSRGRSLEVNHHHHSIQEEEGKGRHNIPVKLDLRRAVQMDQPAPAAQRLLALRVGGVTVERTATGGSETSSTSFTPIDLQHLYFHKEKKVKYEDVYKLYKTTRLHCRPLLSGNRYTSFSSRA